MTLLSTIFPDLVSGVGSKAFVVPGPFTFVVPAATKWVRVSLRPCGGQGDNWGGGGAFVRERFTATPGDNLEIQVGTASQASAVGDSFVKRSGVTLAYAERGRGSGVGGGVVVSVGTIERAGETVPNSGTLVDQHGGVPGSDAVDAEAIFGDAVSTVQNDNTAVGPGAGGRLIYIADYGGTLQRYAYPAGSGFVFVECFDGQPSA